MYNSRVKLFPGRGLDTWMISGVTCHKRLKFLLFREDSLRSAAACANAARQLHAHYPLMGNHD